MLLGVLRMWRVGIAKLSLIIVLLFFAAPQLGSRDVDGDDFPEIPIVVLAISDFNSRDASIGIEALRHRFPSAADGLITAFPPRTTPAFAADYMVARKALRLRC